MPGGQTPLDVVNDPSKHIPMYLKKDELEIF